jgi:hypothetical protein
VKYYKITNSEEKHNDMQYKTGLNVDILPFNPSGNCAPGGIYFSREDILAFLDYGPWIREVILPEDTQIYENPGLPKKWKVNKVILGERKEIDLEVIKSLIEEGADIHADGDHALKFAAEYGHIEVVKYLVEQGADVHADNNHALRCSAKNGHLNIVEFLVEKGANIHIDNDYVLRHSAKNGNLELVKFLIEKGANIHICDDYAIRWAGISGHSKVVKYLVEQGADIHNVDNCFLRLTCYVNNIYIKVVKFLKSIK